MGVDNDIIRYVPRLEGQMPCCEEAGIAVNSQNATRCASTLLIAPMDEAMEAR